MINPPHRSLRTSWHGDKRVSERRWHLCKKLEWFSAFELLNISTFEYSNISEACRHHDHSKKYDNYLFSSCNSCNLQMDDFDNKIHFFAHGGGSYDMNLILKECTRKINIDVLPKTSNTYHRVTINNSLVFPRQR